MIGLALLMWLLFTLGIALERGWARRTWMFPMLWLIMAASLIGAYAIGGIEGLW